MGKYFYSGVKLCIQASFYYTKEYKNYKTLLVGNGNVVTVIDFGYGYEIHFRIFSINDLFNEIE